MSTCVPWELDSACCNGWSSNPPALRERAETLAWDALRTLTGGRVGTCPVVMRPCLSVPCSTCANWSHHGWVRAAIRDGIWLNMLCGTPECSCKRLCEIVFPGEVAAIVEITLDGQTVDPATYRLDNGNRLVRTDDGCWPSCQDIAAPPTEVGTLAITYVPGIVPDEAGLWAAGVLACEFALACSGSKCRLPSSVTAIVREGVAYTLGTAMFPGGMTGIREVDAYVLSVNPHRLKMPSTVWSPDVPWAKHRYETPQAPVVP